MAQSAGPPGGINEWEYQDGMGGQGGTMIQDMAELVGVINGRLGGILRSSHLDAIDAQIVQVAIEDAYDHLRAPCNSDLLKRIIKHIADEEDEAAMVLFPATLRFAIIRCDASMSGAGFDLILQMFVKQLREIPHLARPGDDAGGGGDDEEDEDDESSGFFKTRREED